MSDTSIPSHPHGTSSSPPPATLLKEKVCSEVPSQPLGCDGRNSHLGSPSVPPPSTASISNESRESPEIQLRKENKVSLSPTCASNMLVEPQNICTNNIDSLHDALSTDCVMHLSSDNLGKSSHINEPLVVQQNSHLVNSADSNTNLLSTNEIVSSSVQIEKTNENSVSDNTLQTDTTTSPSDSLKDYDKDMSHTTLLLRTDCNRVDQLTEKHLQSDDHKVKAMTHDSAAGTAEQAKCVSVDEDLNKTNLSGNKIENLSTSKVVSNIVNENLAGDQKIVASLEPVKETYLDEINNKDMDMSETQRLTNTREETCKNLLPTTESKKSLDGANNLLVFDRVSTADTAGSSAASDDVSTADTATSSAVSNVSTAATAACPAVCNVSTIDIGTVSACDVSQTAGTTPCSTNVISPVSVATCSTAERDVLQQEDTGLRSLPIIAKTTDQIVTDELSSDVHMSDLTSLIKSDETQNVVIEETSTNMLEEIKKSSSRLCSPEKAIKNDASPIEKNMDIEMESDSNIICKADVDHTTIGDKIVSKFERNSVTLNDVSSLSKLEKDSGTLSDFIPKIKRDTETEDNTKPEQDSAKTYPHNLEVSEYLPKICKISAESKAKSKVEICSDNSKSSETIENANIDQNIDNKSANAATIEASKTSDIEVSRNLSNADSEENSDTPSVPIAENNAQDVVLKDKVDDPKSATLINEESALCVAPKDGVLQTVVGGVLQTLHMTDLASRAAEANGETPTVEGAESEDQAVLFSGTDEVPLTTGALHVLENSPDEADGIGGLVINSVVGAFGEAVEETMEQEKDLADISGGSQYADVTTAKDDDLPRSKRPRMEDPMTEVVHPVVIKMRPVRGGDLQMIWDSEKLRTALVEKGTILLRLCTVEPLIGEEFETASDFVGVVMDSVDDVNSQGDRLDTYPMGLDGGLHSSYGQYAYNARAPDGGDEDFVETEEVEEALDYDAGTTAVSPDWQGKNSDSAAQRRAMPPPPPPPLYYHSGHSPLSPPPSSHLPRVKRKHGMRGRPPLHMREAYAMQQQQHQYYYPNNQQPSQHYPSMLPPHTPPKGSPKPSQIMMFKTEPEAPGLKFRPPTPPPLDASQSGSHFGTLRKCSSLLSVRRPAPGSILSVQMKLQYKEQENLNDGVKSKSSSDTKIKNAGKKIKPLGKHERIYCDFCPTRFRKRTAMLTHMRHKHRLMQKCPICNVGIKVKGKYNMKFHILKNHKDINAFACGDCGAVFRLQHHLKNHLKLGCERQSTADPEPVSVVEAGLELTSEDILVPSEDVSSNTEVELVGSDNCEETEVVSDIEEKCTVLSKEAQKNKPKPGKRKKISYANDSGSDIDDKKKDKTFRTKITKPNHKSVRRIRGKVVLPNGDCNEEDDTITTGLPNSTEVNGVEPDSISTISTDGSKISNCIDGEETKINGLNESAMSSNDDTDRKSTELGSDDSLVNYPPDMNNRKEGTAVSTLKSTSKDVSDGENYTSNGLINDSHISDSKRSKGFSKVSSDLSNVCMVIDNVIKLTCSRDTPSDNEANYESSDLDNDAKIIPPKKKCFPFRKKYSGRGRPRLLSKSSQSAASDGSDNEFMLSEPETKIEKISRGRGRARTNFVRSYRKGNRYVKSVKPMRNFNNDENASNSDDEPKKTNGLKPKTSSIIKTQNKKRARSPEESDNNSDAEHKKKQTKITRSTRLLRRSKSGSHSDSDDRFSDVDKKKVTCENCDAEFETEIELKNHEKQFLLRGLLICKSEDTSDDEEEDSDSSKSRKLLSCSKCDKQLTNSYLLRRHMNTHTRMEAKPVKPTSAVSTDSLESRLKSSDLSSYIVKNGKMYTCTKCDLSFKVVNSVTYHMKKVHETLYPFKACEYCGKIFRSCGPYYKHVKAHQRKSCPVDGCKRLFRTMFKMRLHQKKSHADYPYFCVGCYLLYKEKQELDDHIQERHPELLAKLSAQATARQKTKEEQAKEEEEEEEEEDDEDENDDDESENKSEEKSIIEKMDLEILPDKRKTRKDCSYNEEEECAEFIAVTEATVTRRPIVNNELKKYDVVAKDEQLFSGRNRGKVTEVDRLKQTEFNFLMPTGDLERGSRRKAVEETEKILAEQKQVIKFEKAKKIVKPVKMLKKKIDRSWTAALKARMKAEARAGGPTKTEKATPSTNKKERVKATKPSSKPVKQPTSSEIIANDNLAALVVRRVAETLASQQVADLKMVVNPCTPPPQPSPLYSTPHHYYNHTSPPPPPSHHLHHYYNNHPHPTMYGQPPQFYHHHHHHQQQHHAPLVPAYILPPSEDSSSSSMDTTSRENSSHSMDRAASPAKELRFDNF